MSGTLAKHTIFSVGDGSGSEVFTAITDVTSFSWSGVNWSNEDTTSNDNATPVKTMQQTVYSNGDVSLTITYDPSNTQHALLRSLSTTGVAHNYQITHVNSAEHVQFSGFVSSFQWDTPTTGLLKAKVKISVNGAFTSL